MTTDLKKKTTRDLTVRSYRAAPDSANREERTIESVMATEEPVQVFDYRRWEAIREILLMDGLEKPDQVPLLDNHNRFDCADVFGSTRNLRIENGKLIGRNYFASDERSQNVFDKVADGHIRDNSIGYSVEAFQDIDPGESRTIGNREFTAGSEALRVVTKWKLRENSITPIGADEKAKMRSEAKKVTTDKKVDKAEEKKTAPVAETDSERSLREIETNKRTILAICPTGLEHVAQRSILAGHSVEEARAAMLEAHADMAKPVGTPQISSADEKERKDAAKAESDKDPVKEEVTEEVLKRSICRF